MQNMLEHKRNVQIIVVRISINKEVHNYKDCKVYDLDQSFMLHNCLSGFYVLLGM